MSEWETSTHEQQKKGEHSENAKAKMDFAMKDFEAGASATAAMGDAVNVQHKKSFDIADVDSNEMKLEVIMNALAEQTKQQQRGDRVLCLFCVLFCF